MPSFKILTLYEHDEVSYGCLSKKLGISEHEIEKSLRKLNRAFARNPPKSMSNDSPEETELNENKGFLLLYSDAVRARHYVGFATIDNLLIQVLPKVFKSKGSNKNCTNQQNYQGQKEALLAFIRMLNVSYGLKIRDVELANLRYSKIPNSILEIFIHLFAKSLWEEVQKGYYREYQEIQQEEKFLRGKLLVSRQIKKLPHKRHTFSVELHEFSEDNLLNQIFYATIRFSLSKTMWLANKKLLSELMMVFDGVSFRRITEADLRKVHFTRLNDRFRKPFNLVKIILKSFGGISGEEVGGFFVDMNELFERFILWVLKKSLQEYEVEYQRELNLFDEKKGGNIITRKQYPDFIISKNSIPVAVLDAKYRPLGIKEGKLQISPDLLRQVYVYAKILEEKYDVSRVPTVLIFPKSYTYNSSIKTEDNEATVGSAMFFDGRKLLVMVYDMETLKKELKIEEIEKKFGESLKKSLCDLLNP
ncbi:hypothetical protein ADU37_CDS20500 [Thermococcus sp. 2319x1]|uniref:McrC family protein n=1 Tax=Thermococcus sp. 2319x1 TaxID=1674923 RepID=UPI00073AA55A|nr:hypothetical protein [Thermococcus sp. 2319x1]ALV63749.1 hypothetical protein ADU37_CDS20500 [Thermococcus sp. 2319x1]